MTRPPSDRDRLKELADRFDLALTLDESAVSFHLSGDDMKAIAFSLRFVAEQLLRETSNARRD